MLWYGKQEKKNRRRNIQKPSSGTSSLRRPLGFEGLESRNLMASGVVDVRIGTFAPPGTILSLVGDGSNNEVDINQTVTAGEFTIQGKNGTLLKLNGAFATTPSMTVNGINGPITIDLNSGNDIFRFLPRSDSQPSNVPGNLTIINSDGSNINSLTGVLINGNLNVVKANDTSGYSELSIISSTIAGSTTVNNDGGEGGDTKLVIDSSWLQGTLSAPALALTNGVGTDINNVKGNSQFGLGPFAATAPVVSIDNGDGGSQTTFTGASRIAGFGTTTVYGRLDINNGNNVPGFLDLVTFQATNVLGPVNVDNGDGTSQTLVIGSTLGSHLVLGGDNRPTVGGPLAIANDSGYDELWVTNSTLPWGLSVNNNAAGANSNWGSATSIGQSSIGTGPYGPRTPLPVFVAGVAFMLQGDNGRDIVNLDGSTVGGRVDLVLNAGNNEFRVMNNSNLAGLSVISTDGNDLVSIDRSKILVDIYMRLGNGADELYVRNLNFLEDWPSSLLGVVDINAELGVDRTNLSSLIPNGFELIVP